MFARLPENDINNVEFDGKRYSLPGYTYVDVRMDGLQGLDEQESHTPWSLIDLSPKSPAPDSQSHQDSNLSRDLQSPSANEYQVPEKSNIGDIRSDKRLSQYLDNAYSHKDGQGSVADTSLIPCNDTIFSRGSFVQQLQPVHVPNVSTLQPFRVRAERAKPVTEGQRWNSRVVDFSGLKLSNLVGLITPSPEKTNSITQHEKNTQTYEVIEPGQGEGRDESERHKGLGYVPMQGGIGDNTTSARRKRYDLRKSTRQGRSSSRDSRSKYNDYESEIDEEHNSARLLKRTAVEAGLDNTQPSRSHCPGDNRDWVWPHHPAKKTSQNMQQYGGACSNRPTSTQLNYQIPVSAQLFKLQRELLLML